MRLRLGGRRKKSKVVYLNLDATKFKISEEWRSEEEEEVDLEGAQDGDAHKQLG
ncbi:hypothetical protein SLEP1_g17357 [Rubroshorea leprosula]|uniref:Uncharacterized protein n=1 Tax=Rubroshorea leprosula TaxID=152421 RepID=A0AAV5J5Q2_9ROSI|nr:hypothetical protein SLEP1_g17357 [Rubroshorea leprosula]